MKIIAKAPLWLIVSLFIMAHTSETVIAIAMPALAKHLDVSDNLMQLSSSIYFFGIAIGIFSWGRISDIYGRRPIMLIGISIYIIATLLCLRSTSINEFLLIRFFQAIGASVASVVCQAMTRDSFRESDLSNAFVSISIGLSMVPSIGPLLGGYIVEFLGWQYNFLFLSIVSFCMLNLCFFVLPETNPNIGLPITNSYWEIFKTVITDRKLLFFATTVGCYNGMMFGFYVSSPFIFIKTLGLSPSHFGKFGIALGSALFIGGTINRKLIKKYIQPQRIILAGLRISLFSCSILMILGWLRVESTTHVYVAASAIIFCMVIHLLGHAFVVPTCLRLALEDYTKTVGTAGSIFGGIYYNIIALISFTISRIHSPQILPLTILFFCLSLYCFISFTIYYRRFRKQTGEYN